jgi:hypothetical protein
MEVTKLTDEELSTQADAELGEIEASTNYTEEEKMTLRFASPAFRELTVRALQTKGIQGEFTTKGLIVKRAAKA